MTNAFSIHDLQFWGNCLVRALTIQNNFFKQKEGITDIINLASNIIKIQDGPHVHTLMYTENQLQKDSIQNLRLPFLKLIVKTIIICYSLR